MSNIIDFEIYKATGVVTDPETFEKEIPLLIEASLGGAVTVNLLGLKAINIYQRRKMEKKSCAST